jgi:hypothetical protein
MLDERIERARRAALAVLKPSKKDLKHGRSSPALGGPLAPSRGQRPETQSTKELLRHGGHAKPEVGERERRVAPGAVG